jgi:hypothetical protein
MNSETDKPWQGTVWKTEDGQVLSCVEKLKVLHDNLREIEELCQDAFEDALLMGCDEQQIRSALRQLIAGLKNPYKRD